MAFSNASKCIVTISLILSIGCFGFLASCTETTSKKPTKTDTPVKENAEELSGITLKTFETENGWGYDIFRNGKKYIHQATKPAVGGNKGFTTKLQAEKVGALVIQKIEKGIIPPSVTEAEVDSLTLLYAN